LVNNGRYYPLTLSNIIDLPSNDVDLAWPFLL